MPNSATRLYGLLGGSVNASPSPAMHNAAFRGLGLRAVYVAFSVSEEALGRAVEGLRALNAGGFNVTMPHKVRILKHIDELSAEAGAIGAVNTVVNCDGKLMGYNTDVDGIRIALAKHGIKGAGGSALIVGAGGAARACLLALKEEGFATVTICNRSRARALEAERLALRLGLRPRLRPLAWLEGARNLDFDVLINATPLQLGLAPRITSKALAPLGAVLDLVYRPVRTPLLQLARRAHVLAIPGHEVLLAQAAKAIELWTKRKAPLEAMRRALLRALGDEG